MLKDNDEKNKILGNFNSLRKEIDILRKELNSINDEKETWFKKKEDLKHEVLNLIKEVKILRENKENYSNKIKELKVARDKYNKEVKEKIERLKGIKTIDKRKFSPGVIKEKIDKLELKIETEALSLNNEKKVMKEINKLRKEYKESKIGQDESSSISHEITDLKKKAEELHRTIQEDAKKSQDQYVKLNALSNRIKVINKEQEIAFEKFLDFKNKFVEKTNLLEERLKKAGEYGVILDGINKTADKRKKITSDKYMEQKVKGVEEKLKAGKKLTKEDLIFFQKDDN